MAVSSVQIVDITGNEADDGTVTYTTTWQVITTAATDGPSTVFNAASLPKRGDSLSGWGTDFDPNASCRSRSLSLASKDDTRRVWHVACNYSTKGSSQSPDDNGGDPIDWKWNLSLGQADRTIAPDKDRNGRAFVNAAKEPFLPPPERELKLPVLHFTKNNPSIPLAAWTEAPGKVNSVAMWGVGVRLFKLASWTAKPHYVSGGRMYWEMALDVEVKWGGHYYQPPNLGHRELAFDGVAGAVRPRAILDALAIPISRPALLGMFGEALPDGAAPLFFDQAAGPLQKFEIEEEYDLSTILPPVLPGNFT